nr:hypothetical protein [Tanacetum cinerariifolium]
MDSIDWLNWIGIPWTASPSDSTSPLSHDHPLTQKSPTPTPSQASYYSSTARMTVRTQPTLSPGYSAKLTEAMTLSPLSFHKRYKSSYETPSSSASPASSPTLPIRKRYQGTFELILETKTEGPQMRLLGLGYRAARRHALELAKDRAPSTFEVGQSSRSVPEWQTVGKAAIQAHPSRPARTT